MKRGYLLLIIIILLIITGSVIYLITKPTAETPVVDLPIGQPIVKVTDRNNYYMVENCVNKFYSYYASIYENKNPQEDDVKRTYNLLDKSYINFKNITEENLPTILPTIDESVVNIYDMFVSTQNDSISVYIVEGILREETSKNLSNFKIMVKIDSTNNTFSVLLEDYINAKYSNLELQGNMQLENLNDIEKNRNNIYVYENISDKTYVTDLLGRYKEEALYNSSLAYEHLNEEYKIGKFGSLSNYLEYLDNNLTRNLTSKLKQYKISKEDGYTQYVCIDQNGYYYIFRETGLMTYSLMLDTYTVDLPEFLDKYNAASTVERGAYNIQKWLDAINSKDYKYAYNKLDFEFRAVNYAIIENFEEDIKTNLFNRNKVKAVSSLNEGNTYIYKLTISDMENDEKEQNLTVIMQLKEGTDFVMSFSFTE